MGGRERDVAGHRTSLKAHMDAQSKKKWHWKHFESPVPTLVHMNVYSITLQLLIVEGKTKELHIVAKLMHEQTK